MNALKTTILLAALTGVLLLVGRALGGTAGMIIGLGFAILMNGASYWYSDRIALKMSRGREVTAAEAPELHRMVEEAARAAGMPKPKVAMIPSEAPNAFATGRNPDNALVAVTVGIMRILDRRELYAVLAHELGHVRNRDILVSSVAATIGGAITLLAHLGYFAALFGGRRNGGGAFSALLMIILAPIAATIIQLAISRSREFGADATGAEISGDPEALASALLKLERGSQQIPLPVDPAASHLFIVKPLTGSMMQNLFATHPSTAQRVERLRAMKRR
jgi:heat shock protein HtpX